MLVYFDQKKARSFKIEVYNSFEIAGLMNQNKSTKLCINVNNSSDIEQLFQAVKEIRMTIPEHLHINGRTKNQSFTEDDQLYRSYTFEEYDFLEDSIKDR